MLEYRQQTLPPIDRELQGLDDIELEPEPEPEPSPKPKRKRVFSGFTPNEYARRLRTQRKASGMCGYGCGRKARKSKYACTTCLDKFRKGGVYGCDKPGRNKSRKNLGLVDRRTKKYRDKLCGGPPKRRHRGPRMKK